MTDLDEDKKNETDEDYEYEYEYEYEYVEVPEGEEVEGVEGEDYEYEYEYVEELEGEQNKTEEVSVDKYLEVGEPLESFDEDLEKIDLEKISSPSDDISFEVVEEKTTSESNFEAIDIDALLQEPEKVVEEIDVDKLLLETPEDEKSVELEEINLDDFLAQEQEISSLGEVSDKEDESFSDGFDMEYTEIPEEDVSLLTPEMEKKTEEIVSYEEIEEPVLVADESKSELKSEPETILESMIENPHEVGFAANFIEQEDLPVVKEEVLEQEEPIVEEESTIEEEPIIEVEQLVETVPVVEEPVAEEIVEPEQVFEEDVSSVDYKVLTEDLAFVVHPMTHEGYLNALDFSKVVTKSDSVSLFFASRKKDTVYIGNAEESELSQWTLIVLDRKMFTLKKGSNTFPLVKNAVRFSKLIKDGQERIGFFNEETYETLPQADSFGMIEGKFITGQVGEDSGLLINDFINISLVDFAGKKLEFDSPISGMLVGPNGAILYFSNLKNLILPQKGKKQLEDYQESSVKLSSDVARAFLLNAQDEAKTFSGTTEMSNININVGITTYGWNVSFDNEVTMSLRDLMSYQAKNGHMPSENGKITYGRKEFAFEKIKHIAFYEAQQYFSYI
ncbi:MAG: hypothetical protein PHE89_03165 [Alphaproteobacteria bacterium]|nr:hypothetical protein [Alphaproteobacteria bacterium]